MSAAEPDGSYQLINPPPLKQRVGVGRGIDAELVRRAKTAVDRIRTDYLHRVATTAGDVTHLINATKKPTGDRVNTPGAISRIFRDVQMQAAALDYPLVNDICKSLCSYVEHLDAPEELDKIVVRAHTDALRSVVNNSVTGDGGHLGRALIKSLNELVDKSR